MEDRAGFRLQPLTVIAEGLACIRGGRPVFADLSFRLEPGRMLAVTGPNGAGKSSLLRLVAGLVAPSAGTLLLDGAGEGGADERRALHYLGHADALKPALTLRETLVFWCALAGGVGVPVAEAASRCGLAHVLDLRTGVLSAGQRRRAGLARLLASPRPLWLLDEPTASLDCAGIDLLGTLLAAHLAGGGSVIAATHEALTVAAHATLDMSLHMPGMREAA